MIITEVEKQLSDKDKNKEVSLKKKALCDFLEISKMFFGGLKLRSYFRERNQVFCMRI